MRFQCVRTNNGHINQHIIYIRKQKREGKTESLKIITKTKSIINSMRTLDYSSKHQKPHFLKTKVTTDLEKLVN